MSVKTVQAIINGATTTLTYNSSTGKYEATITAPSGSSYNNNGWALLSGYDQSHR